MKQFACAYCGTSAPETAFYCMRCAQPVRCRDCKAPLVQDARACIQCGKLVPEQTTAGLAQGSNTALPQGYNRIAVHERSESHSYESEFVFSDTIGHVAVELLAHLDRQRFGRGAHHLGLSAPPARPSGVVDASTESPLPGSDGEEVRAGAAPAGAATPSPDASTRSVGLDSIFAVRDDKLHLQLSDLAQFKANSEKDCTYRLVHLFLYAHQQMLGIDSVPKAAVFEFLKFVGFNPRNSSVYLGKDGGTDRNDPNGWRLNLKGLEHAKRSLAQILSPEHMGKWPAPADAKATNRARRAGKRTSDVNSEEQEQLDKLVSHEATLRLAREIPHELLSSHKPIDQALIALYGIKHAGLDREVLPALIERYLYDGFKLSVPAEKIRLAMGNALRHKSTYLTHKPRIGFAITPSGERYVDENLKLRPHETPVGVASSGANGAAPL